MALVACSNGESTPPENGDGGVHADASPLQLDATQYDSRPPQPQDAGPVPDGMACNTTGGKPVAGLCKAAGECSCPNVCVNLYDSTEIAGSCWKACTGQAGECQANETCVTFSDTESACLTTGTLTGTGLNGIAMLDGTPQLPLAGSANLVLSVGDISTTFSVGYGRKSSSGNYYFVFLFPGTVNQPDISKQLIISCDSTKWGVKAFDLADAATGGCHVLYVTAVFDSGNGDLKSWTDQAILIDGTLNLTAAGAGGSQPVTGTFTGPPSAVKLIMEECGANSTPC
jgi:hypothetical protein